ncbi:MAG: hypothetical protein IPM35_32180 [Myxococcales bacterium]|nr:hypothetical protein [Myxococcales bacterium]
MKRQRALSRSLLRWACLALPFAPSGCFFWCTVNEEDGAVKYDADLLNDSMRGLLRPGACALRSFTATEPGAAKLAVRWFEGQGSQLGFVSGTFGATLQVGAEGTLVAKTAPAGELDGASAAPLGSGFLAVTCSQGAATLAYLEQASQLRSAPLAAAGCDAVVGAGAGAVSAVLATRAGDDVGLRSVDAKLAETGARTTQIAGAARLRLADEPEAGVLAVAAQLAAGGWVYREIDASGATVVEHTASLGGDLGEGVRARREPSGTLLVAVGDTLSRWHVGSDGHVEAVQTAEPPDIGSGQWASERWFGGATALKSEPNLDEPSLLVPLAYRSRAASSGGFVVLKPPTTPCRADDFCRNVGESSLVGVIAHQGKPWGIYEVWAWAQVLAEGTSGKKQSLHAVYAAPLFESTEPANALGCQGVDLDAGGSGGSGGVGGSAGSDSGDASGDVGPDVSVGGSGGVSGSAGSGGAGGASGSGGASGGSAGAGGTSGSGGASGGSGGASGGSGGASGGSGGLGGASGSGGASGGSGGATGGSGGATGGSGGASGGSGGATGGAGGCGGATAPLTGTPTVVTTVTGTTQLTHLAVDATHVYIGTYALKELRRAPIGGGTSETVGSTSLNVMGVAHLANDAYFTDVGGQVIRAAKAGGSQSVLASLGSDGIGLTVNASFVHALRLANPGPLFRIPVGGGSPTSIGTFPVTTRSVVEAPTRFIAGGASAPKLYSMPLSGGTATELVDLGPGGRDVGQLAYDAGKVWVASFQSNEILVVDESCLTVTAVRSATDTNKVIGIALSPTHVYWSSFQDNRVWSLPR